MQEEFSRYAMINTHMKRELLLLQGRGCKWKKCTFCDYYNDVSNNPFSINQPIIDKITGMWGVVDVINSGSIFEIDPQSMEYLKNTLIQKMVKTLWCEAHWMYHPQLYKIRKFFDGIDVKFRLGIETFNPTLRSSWNKGIPEKADIKSIAKSFDGACLLIGIRGQTREIILQDIQLAMKHFSYFSLNVFVENTSNTKRDIELIKWFSTEVAPTLKKYEHIEVLIENTDLGVG